MNRVLAAEPAADELDRPVGDDLVDVHIGLRARAGLPDMHRELSVQRAGDDLVGDLADEAGLPLRQAAPAAVHRRAGLLHKAVGVINGGGHDVAADVEVGQRPLGLRAPVVAGRDLHLPQRVPFGPRTGGADAHRQRQHPGGILPARSVHSSPLSQAHPEPTGPDQGMGSARRPAAGSAAADSCLRAKRYKSLLRGRGQRRRRPRGIRGRLARAAGDRPPRGHLMMLAPACRRGWGAARRNHARACGTSAARARPPASTAGPCPRPAGRGSQAAAARCPSAPALRR